MKDYPAIDVRTRDVDLVLAMLDDFEPTAIEASGDGLRAFFQTTGARDAALGALAHRYDVSPIEVSDEDWARRSQENLAPVTVGRITVAPPWALPKANGLTIVVEPSMGFGTGHHATTRLCLAALQTLDLAGRAVLDVGTGSGVLAIAASLLGAARADGVDVDPDAIHSAQDSLERNRADGVSFSVADLQAAALPTADVVVANLTGALLRRSAPRLLAAVRSGGALVLGGILDTERDDVAGAFAGAAAVWERREDGWVGLIMKKT